MTAIALLLLTLSQVSVRDFGAKGDGVTDDTAAFTRAIAASRRVNIPAGVFRVGQIRLGQGTHLYGLGRDATVLLDTGSGSVLVDGSRSCVLALDVADAGVHQLTIRGRGDGDADSIGLAVHACPRFICTDCAVENFRGRGAWVQHRVTTAASFRNVVIRNIRQRADGCYGIGVWIYGARNFDAPCGGAIYNLTVDGCDAAGVCMDAGTTTGAGTPVSRWSVTNLTLLNCATRKDGGAAALTLSGAQQCQVKNVVIDWPTSVATGPAVLFARDETGVACERNAVQWFSIHNAWERPIVSDQTDGSNTVTAATVHVRGGGTASVKGTW